MVKKIANSIIGKVVILQEKMFYKQPGPALPEGLTEQEYILKGFEIEKKHNFDCPEAIDWEMLKKTMRLLLNWKPCKLPIFHMQKKIRYFFFINGRVDQAEEVSPANVIILDGSFILQNDDIRKELEIKIFVDTDEDVRLSRRLLTFLNGLEDVIPLPDFLSVYFDFVKPGFEKYIEPSKKYADIIIPNYGFSYQDAKVGRRFFSQIYRH